MFSVRLKELREKLGMSQQKFANSFGVAQSTVGMWESGKREPNYEITQQIADYFNVSVDYLLGRDTKPTLDEQLDGVDFALYGEIHDLTDDEKKDILSYIKFKKSQRGE